MPSSKIQRIAKKIVNNNPELFKSLMEFEDTKKIRTKKRLNFTIDKSIASKFQKYCRNNGYNMSAKVEQMMKKTLEKVTPKI